MKTGKLLVALTVLLSGLSVAVSTSAQVIEGAKTYTVVDLNTGETIDIYYDTVTWRTINRVSTSPVDFYVIKYVDPAKPADTVHGVTGLIVNDLIWKNDAGAWTFNEARVKWNGTELKMKDRYGRKVKWENGSMKIKDWNNKYKSEKGDGAKYKEEWDKIKWKDTETKVEIGTNKTKIENKQ